MICCVCKVQCSTEVPIRRSALSVCPCGDPWGTPLQSELSYSWAPVKIPRGQTLRSPRPKVPSVLTRGIREMGGAPRNPAPRNHLLVRIVKPSGCHCTDASGGEKCRRVPTPLRSTSPSLI